MSIVITIITITMVTSFLFLFHFVCGFVYYSESFDYLSIDRLSRDDVKSTFFQKKKKKKKKRKEKKKCRSHIMHFLKVLHALPPLW